MKVRSENMKHSVAFVKCLTVILMYEGKIREHEALVFHFVKYVMGMKVRSKNMKYGVLFC